LADFESTFEADYAITPVIETKVLPFNTKVNNRHEASAKATPMLRGHDAIQNLRKEPNLIALLKLTILLPTNNRQSRVIFLKYISNIYLLNS